MNISKLVLTISFKVRLLAYHKFLLKKKFMLCFLDKNGDCTSLLEKIGKQKQHHILSMVNIQNIRINENKGFPPSFYLTFIVSFGISDSGKFFVSYQFLRIKSSTLYHIRRNKLEVEFCSI